MLTTLAAESHNNILQVLLAASSAAQAGRLGHFELCTLAAGTSAAG
jgi:hypothetical protein